MERRRPSRARESREREQGAFDFRLSVDCFPLEWAVREVNSIC